MGPEQNRFGHSGKRTLRRRLRRLKRIKRRRRRRECECFPVRAVLTLVVVIWLTAYPRLCSTGNGGNALIFHAGMVVIARPTVLN